MRRLIYLSLAALVVLAIAVPARTGKGKGAAKGKDKPKSAAADTEHGASGKSAHATGSRRYYAGRRSPGAGPGTGAPRLRAALWPGKKERRLQRRGGDES